MSGQEMPSERSQSENEAQYEDDFTKPLGERAMLVCASVTPDASKFLQENGATIETVAGLYLVELPARAVVHDCGTGDFTVVLHPEIEEDDKADLDYLLYEFFPDVHRSSIEMRHIRH